MQNMNFYKTKNEGHDNNCKPLSKILVIQKFHSNREHILHYCSNKQIFKTFRPLTFFGFFIFLLNYMVDNFSFTIILKDVMVIHLYLTVN